MEGCISTGFNIEKAEAICLYTAYIFCLLFDVKKNHTYKALYLRQVILAIYFEIHKIIIYSRNFIDKI